MSALVFLIILFSVIYVIMVMFLTFGLTRVKLFDDISFSENCSPLSFSIVIAVKNEESNIENLFNSLLALDYPKKYIEIVIVNDHSTDGTLQQIERCSHNSIAIKVLHLPTEKSGKKEAISMGVLNATHNNILLTDADCVHSKVWIKHIAHILQHNYYDLLIGLVIIKYSKNINSWLQALEHSSLSASTIGACAIGHPIMASSTNLYFNRATTGFQLEMLNPSTPSGDDVFLLHNLKRNKNLKIGCFAFKKGLVFTKPTNSISEWFKQRTRWASKATSYHDCDTVIVGLIVFLFNLQLVVLGLLSIINLNWLSILIVVFISKLIIDLPFLSVYLYKTKQLVLLWLYLPIQLFYPPFVVLVFLLSQTKKVDWK